MQTKRLRRLRAVRLFSRSCSLQRRKYDGTTTIDDVFATHRISKAIDINGRQRVFHPIRRVLLGTANVDENNPQRMVKLARCHAFISHDTGHEPSPDGNVAYQSLTDICGVSFLKRTFLRSVVSTCSLRFIRTVARYRPRRRSSGSETYNTNLLVYYSVVRSFVSTMQTQLSDQFPPVPIHRLPR